MMYSSVMHTVYLYCILIAGIGALLQQLSSLFPFKGTQMNDPLEDKLNYYEIIQVSRRIVKRGSGSQSNGAYNRQEYISFSAFGRKFDLYVTPKHGLLHQHFTCHQISGDNHEQPCAVNPNEYFGGHVHGASNSVVSLAYDDAGSMLGIVRLDNETYIFEPAKIHFVSAEVNQILAYRDSDMKLRSHGNVSMCSSVRLTQENDSLELSPKRAKRSHLSVERNRCSLRVVATYRFYKAIGNGSLAFAARYLINVIDRVNALYKVTDWGADDEGRRLTNMGFMIKDMIIHTSPTLNEPNHYNSMQSSKRSVKAVLDNFSRLQGTNNYCLAHLFTAESFDDGVLGLGYISSSAMDSPGGICSIRILTVGGPVYYNTALSSAKATHGGTVISREAEIVTAHELGHNWGAVHDDLSTECSPPYSSGGSYVMNTFSASGYDPNNHKFSPCSRRMIGKVLARKAELCFEQEMSGFCGNGRVENDTDGFVEECDVGTLLSGTTDKCCTSDCRLKPGALCSPKNSPCCSSDCQFLPSTHLCLHENKLQCKLSSHCSGVSAECPEPGPVEDGTPCIEDGECLRGQCLTFCERPSHNKKPCICRNEADTCLRCCRSANGTCEPYSRDAKYVLKDGTRCIHGYCMKAVCIKEVADVVSHFWNIIESIDETNFWTFVMNNLVGIIITVMLLIWIPISVFVHKIDKADEMLATADDKIEIVPGQMFISDSTDLNLRH